MAEAGDSRGLIRTLRRIGAHLVEGVEYRLELAAVEVKLERKRLVRLMLGALMTSIFALLAFLCLNLYLLVLFWEHRALVTLSLFALYALVALVLGVAIRRRARAAPPPLAATLEELRKDRESILSKP